MKMNQPYPDLSSIKKDPPNISESTKKEMAAFFVKHLGNRLWEIAEKK